MYKTALSIERAVRSQGYMENKMPEERKLIKVIMEYDNGDKEYIEGDDVTKWQNAINGAIMLDYTHRRYTQNVLKDVIWKKL